MLITGSYLSMEIRQTILLNIQLNRKNLHSVLRNISLQFGCIALLRGYFRTLKLHVISFANHLRTRCTAIAVAFRLRWSRRWRQNTMPAIEAIASGGLAAGLGVTPARFQWCSSVLLEFFV